MRKVIVCTQKQYDVELYFMVGTIQRPLEMQINGYSTNLYEFLEFM